jgi:hypothetical protein
MGANGVPAQNFPLEACQGACDYDYNCDWGHLCMHCSNTERVPACNGCGEVGVSYCYRARSDQLRLHGVGGKPSQSYPLGTCKGNCRSDSDCEEGLVCLVRSGIEEVVGCRGVGEAGFSYCYDPSWAGGSNV